MKLSACILLGLLCTGCFNQNQPTQRVLPEPAAEDTTNSQYIVLKSKMGRLKFRLFQDTPKHRDAFLKVLQDTTLQIQFVESIPNLLLRGEAKGTYKSPFLSPETSRLHAHVRGQLCANLNKEGLSDVSRFYVVLCGIPLSDAVLSDLSTQVRLQTRSDNFSFSQKNYEKYKTAGGAPWLDMQYTCFGTLETGMDALEAISRLKTKGNNAGKAKYRFENENLGILTVEN